MGDPIAGLVLMIAGMILIWQSDAMGRGLLQMTNLFWRVNLGERWAAINRLILIAGGLFFIALGVLVAVYGLRPG